MNFRGLRLSAFVLCLVPFWACSSGDTGSTPNAPINWGDNGSNPPNPNPWADTTSQTDGASGQDTTSTAQAIDSPEMVLKIVSPSAYPYATATGTTGFLSGIVTGAPDSITWQTETGATGSATGVPFWKTGAIPLNPGDNAVVVTATRGQEVQTDKVTITVNRGFKFGSRLRARPNVLFSGQNVAVVFAINADLYMNYVPDSLQLIEVDQSSNPLGNPNSMSDGGDTSVSGDEIEQDGIYTARVNINAVGTGTRYFRVTCQVKEGVGVSYAYSEILEIKVVAPVTPTECEQIVQLHQNARAQYDSSLPNAGQKAAVQNALTTIQGSGQVAESGITQDGHRVWVRYTNGILGALPLSPTGYRGGPSTDATGDLGTVDGGLLNTVQIGSRRALLLSPAQSDIGAMDENNEIAQMFNEVQCPYYNVTGPLQNSAANLSSFQDMWKYGVISIAAHGDTYFDELSLEAKEAYGWFHKGAQELIWTGEPINCDAFNNQVGASCTNDATCGAGARCVIQSLSGGTPQGVCVDYVQADLRSGRIAMGTNTYGILPSFVMFHAKEPYPNSVVYLGACRSAWNGSMAAALFGMGARSILGYTNYISNQFAHDRGVDFFDRIIRQDPNTGKALTSGQAHSELPDPDNPSAKFRLIGARNLDASNSEIINESFETGKSSGWFKEGDGRVIAQLGESVPVSGKFMGILSTGLGYTQTSGELSQTFCIPEGRTKLSVWWRFFSEEFLEFCGSDYQDEFFVTLENTQGMVYVVKTRVDDICPQDGLWCTWCLGLYELEPSDVHFDKGDAYKMVDWVKSEVSLVGTGMPGGGPVTLRLFASDTSDSIYDSVVLIDGVKIE